MFYHSIEYLAESWFVASWDKTPRIPKRCTTYHKTIEVSIVGSWQLAVGRIDFIYDCILLLSALCPLSSIGWMRHLRKSVFITHHIPVTEYGYAHMLLEIIYSCEVSLSCKGLLVRATMY